ncbi:MAG TPA: R3H domain-containing nucleic acid-binding protein [Thermoanaerobaculia bacterium]|nr:R3H domain-containing nucleic acid-binding protein [Thermoanaerobaculia bacterium]
MSEPKRRFFSGDTLQQALVQAAIYFGLEPHEIAYRPIEKRHGFLKVRRNAVIEVDPESPRRTASSPPPAPPAARQLPPTPPAPPPPVAPPAPPAAPVSSAPPPPAEAPAPEPPARPERDAEHRMERPRESRPREREGGRFDRDRGPRDRPPGDRPDRGPRERGGRFDRDRGPRERPAGDRPPGDRPARGRFDRPDRDRPSFADRGERLDRPVRDPGDRGEDRWEPRPQPAPAPPPRPEWDEDAPRPRYDNLDGGLVALPDTPRRPSERYAPARGPQAEAAAQGIALLLRIAGLRLEARILQGEDRLEIDLTGEDADWCFSDEGEFLGAVEHLLPRIIRSLSGEAVICRVDCDNFHEIREERLRTLAQRVASEVRRIGRARTLEPMNPSDRRVIHITLADDPKVVTESEGEGYFKRITVRPA